MNGFFETLEYLTLHKADVTVKRGIDYVEVCIIGARCSDSWFKTYRVFIQSALQVLGYESNEGDIDGGLMRLVFKHNKNGVKLGG